MELQFTKTNEGYIAEFEATADFNLHIKRETAGLLEVFQRTVPNGNHDSVDMSKYFNREHKTIDCEFSGAVYPKYIKVVSQVEVISAEVTLKPAKSGDLQLKQVTITENGTQSVIPDAEYSGMSKVVVNTDVNTLQGLDFSKIYDAEQANEINQYYKDGIEYAKQISQEWVADVNRTSLFNENKRLVFFPNIDLSHLTEWDYDTGIRYSNVEYLPKVINLNSVISLAGGFSEAFLLKSDVEIYANSATSADYIFTDCIGVEKVKLHIKQCRSIIGGFYYCSRLNHLEIEDVSNITNFNQIIQSANRVVTIFLGKWKQSSLQIAQASNVSPESIHYIIQNAVDLADGATARTLTLHATTKANWQNSEFYEQDLAILSTKGITIA